MEWRGERQPGVLRFLLSSSSSSSSSSSHSKVQCLARDGGTRLWRPNTGSPSPWRRFLKKDSDLAGRLAHQICSCNQLFSTCDQGRCRFAVEFGVLLFIMMAVTWSERSDEAEADVWKHLGRSLRFVLLEFWRLEAGNDTFGHISLWV